MRTVLKRVASTQAVIRDLLKTGKKVAHLEHVTADEQTEGRGRQGRAWISRPGNLMVSIYISEYSFPVTWVPHWIGLSVVEALKKFKIDEKRIRMKWPNDVLVDGKKIAGILCERIDQGVIAGIGVNLIDAPSQLEATSLKNSSKEPLSEDVKSVFLDEMIDFLKKPTNLAQLKKMYIGYSLLQHAQAMWWEDPKTGDQGRGRFLRYGDLGEIWVITQDGKEQPLYSEEIHLIKEPKK